MAVSLNQRNRPQRRHRLTIAALILLGLGGELQGDMGKKAAQTLMERLQGKKTGAGTALEMPFDLIQRGSTRTA